MAALPRLLTKAAATDSSKPNYTIAETSDQQCTKNTTYTRVVNSSILVSTYALRILFLYQLWHSAWAHDIEQDVTVARAYFGCQTLLFAAEAIQTAWRLLCNSAVRRPQLRLVGEDVPLVDVVVTTCGEKIDIILDTVRSCCVANYPITRRRILVSDDAADDELRQAVQELASSTDLGLHYFTRNGKGSRKSGAKAGNMNAALMYLDAQNGGVPYPYVVFIDADMIVEPDFLRAELAHMLSCPTAGLCVLPQNFYNIPPNDPLSQSLHTQGQYDEVLRDSARGAWNSGSSALMLREALADVGGVPEHAITEDVLTSILMQGRGWEVIYCNEPLQWGLVPETFLAHVKQRIRWSVGAFRNAKSIGFGTSQSLLPKMTLAQRFLAFSEGARCWFSTPVDVLCRWAFLLLVATGQPLIVGQDMRPMLRTYAAMTVLWLAQDILSSANAGYIAMRRRDAGHVWLSPYLAAACLKELLPHWLGGFKVQFVPTGVSESVLLERNAGTRVSTTQRLCVMILNYGLWYHLTLFALAVTVCTTGAAHCFDMTRHHITLGVWEVLHRHVLVPGINWEFYFITLQPILYAISPPKMPSRQNLLQRASLHGQEKEVVGSGTHEAQRHARWPKPESRELRYDKLILLTVLPHLATELFWITVGICSFA